MAALEEERANRVKHTNAFPVEAIRFCLQEAGVSFFDVDRICLNVAEEFVVRRIAEQASSQIVPTSLTPRSQVVQRFRSAGLDLDPVKLRFVPHHVAHAASAWFLSGLTEALVVSLDGVGDDSELDTASGIIFTANDSGMKRLRTISRYESLGFFYGQVTKLLGFREFDEYKVMGLASYGDRATYRRLFTECCTLTSEGWYHIDRMKLLSQLTRILEAAPRVKAELSKIGSDIAAGCQDLLETVVLHVLRFYHKETRLTNLALAGGVALNCSLNGRILASGIFKEVFVQPAAHDAGGALGAASFVLSQEYPSNHTPPQMVSIYWGRNLPSAETLRQNLDKWSRFIYSERTDEICHWTATHLASGAVIGWVQSRSEFGPRALGNRSILADPRPAANRMRVNTAIKRREGFRPFAPSVIAEKAVEYFDIPNGGNSLPFMLFTVPVHENQRSNLQAVTHVDGTARIQTVSKTSNPKFWRLIDEFGRITGIFVLLNTSFNNSAEPIVDTADDAITAFLTTGLDYLVIDDYWIRKRQVTNDLLLDSVFSVASCAEFGRTGAKHGTKAWIRYCHESGLAIREPTPITTSTFEVLCNFDDKSRLGELLRQGRDNGNHARILEEIRLLWWLRLITLNPGN